MNVRAAMPSSFAGFSPESYGPQIAALLLPPRTCELGPGKPNLAARQPLQSLEKTLSAGKAADDAMLRCCIAGLWLYHDFADESHAISQEIHTQSGSYWHAILHRREPDPSNAKYWFHRVGDHPVLKLLAAQAPALGGNYRNPEMFVDLCERVRGAGTPEEELAKKLQNLEWELLFDHCWRQARWSPA